MELRISAAWVKTFGKTKSDKPYVVIAVAGSDEIRVYGAVEGFKKFAGKLQFVSVVAKNVKISSYGIVVENVTVEAVK